MKTICHTCHRKVDSDGLCVPCARVRNEQFRPYFEQGEAAVFATLDAYEACNRTYQQLLGREMSLEDFISLSVEIQNQKGL